MALDQGARPRRPASAARGGRRRAASRDRRAVPVVSFGAGRDDLERRASVEGRGGSDEADEAVDADDDEHPAARSTSARLATVSDHGSEAPPARASPVEHRIAAHGWPARHGGTDVTSQDDGLPPDEAAGRLADTRARSVGRWRPQAPAWLPRHWLLWTMGVVIVVADCGSASTRGASTARSRRRSTASSTTPCRPRRISSPARARRSTASTRPQSQVSYAVNEKLFGQSAHRAEGTTNGIAGDIALNAAQPGREPRRPDRRQRRAAALRQQPARRAHARSRTSTRTTTRSPTSRSPASRAAGVDHRGHVVSLHDDEPAHREEDAGAGDVERRRHASPTASSPRPRRPT